MLTPTEEVESQETTRSSTAVVDDRRYPRWLANIHRCITYKRTLIPDWATNVDFRRGKMFETDSDQDRVPITVDWSMTKAKQAQLFSAVPEARLTPVPGGPPLPALQMWQRRQNNNLCKARVGVAMDEELPDVINAAGIGAVLVSHETRSVKKMVAKVDQMTAQQLTATGQEVPMAAVPQVVSRRLRIARKSPADLLWPTEFEGSDFDDADWTGYTGRITWEEGKALWGDKLPDDMKSKVVGRDTRTSEDELSYSEDKERAKAANVVTFHEIFYMRYVYHEDETCFEAVHNLVFVDGLEEPVVDEEWKGQQRDPDDEGMMLGAQKRPLRYLTLTYLSDEAIPPSDSAMGRPQVEELIEARSEILRQRKSSVPLRWVNVNRLDPAVMNAIMRGTWQGIIPLNGDGTTALGEVARASYPAEDFRFNDIARSELYDTWQVSPNQTGGTGVNQIRSASEANIIQQNFQTRIGYERARVTAHFVSIVEVAAGLDALHGRLTPAEQQALGDFPQNRLGTAYAFNVRADSTVLLDAQQRYDRLERFLNIGAKSGFVNPKPILTEMAILAGLDVAEVIVDPPKSGPEPANISLRADAETALQDPMVLALLEASGQAPSQENIEAAKQKILSMRPQPAEPPGMPAPGGPPPGGEMEPPPGPTPLEASEAAFPDWNEANRVNKRMEDGQ